MNNPVYCVMLRLVELKVIDFSKEILLGVLHPEADETMVLQM
jgi:hypothetical protein